MKEIKVYIASPYTNGWMPTNIKRQLDMAKKLMSLGYYPYTPLLAHFLEIYIHQPEEKWLELDIVFLKTCDALLRLKPVDNNGNEIYSSGSDKEESIAREYHIPVFYSLDELNDYFKSNSTQGYLDI